MKNPLSLEMVSSPTRKYRYLKYMGKYIEEKNTPSAVTTDINT
jgi:hypothetical protein